MKQIKNISISLSIGILLILTLSFIFNIFYYFDILSQKTFDIIKTIIPILSFFISSFILGMKSSKKGWLEGLKIGIIYLILIIFLNLIFIHEFSISSIIYYLILLLSSVFGSMIGINKKKV